MEHFSIGSLPVSQAMLTLDMLAVADPGFPIGGGVHPLGGHGPPTWALFGENVCENERIGSHRGVYTRHTP